MTLTTSTIASLALTIGALLLLIAVASSENIMKDGRRPPKTSYLRSQSSRKLYNYSTNNNGSSNNYNSYNSASSGNYGGDYGSSNGDDNSGGDYGGGYGDYGNDDASYYNSNSQYEATGSTYNGRDQQWGGQSVQSYTDDEEPEITIEYSKDNWNGQGKFGSLSGVETLAVTGLAFLLSISALALFALANGFNIIHLCQVYCFRGTFGHKDQKEGDTVEEGFVKLGE